MRRFQSAISEFTNDFSRVYSAEGLLLELHFRWDENVQEQWDILARSIKDMQKADPLINLDTGVITRDYDYLTWYTTWTPAIRDIPQSLRNTDELVRNNLILQRQADAKVLKKIYDELTARLAWYVDVKDNEDLYTGILRPNGWILAKDGSWALQFATELDTVGFEQLDKVKIIVEVE